MERTVAPSPSLSEELDRLARFEPVAIPVISLYLNLQADQHGKDNYSAFVKKEMTSRARTYPLRSADRVSFERDAERIATYLANELVPSANGLAIFACAGKDDFFEALTLDAPIESHRLSVSNAPHLYPLARLIDQYPRHAVVLADSHAARLFVFGRGRTIGVETIPGEKINRSSVGGWSQMRYQRHVEKLQAGHARELVAALDRAVREEKIAHIVLAGDEVNIPLVRAELSKELSEKVIEVVKLDVRTPEQEVMEAAAESLRRHDAKTDAESVEMVFGDYRAGGLAVVGPGATWDALLHGQVDTLYLTAALPDTAASEENATAALADELVTKARQTKADVRFIEDPALLDGVGGVAAALRYRLDGPSLRKGQEIA